MTAVDIETAVANLFDFRANMIVPNVHWGLRIHECDLLVLRPTGYCVEVEIKISRDDIKNDLSKRHAHHSDKIKELYFAVPEALCDDPNIPAHAGIIKVVVDRNRYRAEVIRRPVPNKTARPLTAKDVNKLGHLGCMRIWTLKGRLHELKKIQASKRG